MKFVIFIIFRKIQFFLLRFNEGVFYKDSMIAHLNVLNRMCFCEFMHSIECVSELNPRHVMKKKNAHFHDDFFRFEFNSVDIFCFEFARLMQGWISCAVSTFAGIRSIFLKNIGLLPQYISWYTPDYCEMSNTTYH